MDRAPLHSHPDHGSPLVYENVPNIENIDFIVSFVFALPGSNAGCERIFSEVKYFWTQYKSNLKVKTLDAVLKVRHNLAPNCDDMFDLLVKDSALRASINSSDKYQLAKVSSKSQESLDHLSDEDDDEGREEENEETEDWRRAEED